MIQKFAPILIIVLQIMSFIWYLLPTSNHAHIPVEFIRMIIFGGISVLLLIIMTILYIIYKPTGLLWKIPFMISTVMILFTWFYNQ